MDEAAAAHGDSGGPLLIDGKIAAITDFGLNPVVSDYVHGTDPGNTYFGDIDGCERVSYYASWIDSVVNAPIGSPEFRVNTTIADDQKWSSVAMDDNGDFAITWTSYGQDGGGNGPGAGVNGQNGVYVQRYDSTGTAVGGEFRANTFTDGQPAVFQDRDGCGGRLHRGLGKLPGPDGVQWHQP